MCTVLFAASSLQAQPPPQSAPAPPRPSATEAAERSGSPDGAENAKEEERKNLSLLAARITGVSEEHALPAARLTAVRQLSSRLSAQDSRALLRFISDDPPPGFPPNLWHALVNDVADILLKQESRVAGMDKFLIQSARSQPDAVLRDYAVQKLGTLLSRHPADPMRKEAFEALATAAALEGQNLQGTALLSWKGALGGGISSDPAFRRAVSACLNSGKATPPARLTALQAAAEAGMKEAAPAARAFLRDPDSSVALRLSAIAALGRSGVPEKDTALLTPLLNDQAFAPAAAAALKRLATP